MCSDVVNPWVCMAEDLKDILEEGAGCKGIGAVRFGRFLLIRRGCKGVGAGGGRRYS